VRKSMTCMMKRSMTNPKEPSSNINRSQQSWVKTFMQDVMDEKGHVTRLVWQPGMVREEIVFVGDECLCMRAYVEHRRVDTQKAQEQIGTTKCRKSCSCPWQLRPHEGYAVIQTAKSCMGTRRQTSVNRTDAQKSKVWTI
jgi:hypothetical protein